MQREAFERLRAQVAAGERRARHADYRQTTYWQHLALQEAERDDLWRLTPQQRLRRYRAGELTRYQLGCWESGAWHEVPKVNDLPEWFAATLCDIVDEGLD